MPDREPYAFHVMTKPIGPICNLDCAYCFYLEKEAIYSGNRRWAMPDEVLEAYIRDTIAATQTPEVAFAWQGGEPTLLGVGFFRRITELQRLYSDGRPIANAIQTNGTLLDDDWCRFLRDEQYLVGLSLDGPRELHDTYRVDKQGRPSFDGVWRGLELLNKHEVTFNTLTVVNRANSERPLEVYRFLREAGSGFMQFIPLVERALPDAGPHGLASPLEPGEAVTEWSVRPEAFGAFLVRVFDEWVRHDVGKVFVQTFDVTLGNWMRLGSALCVFSEECGRGLALEHNGDLYACDHYVYPEYRRGNIMEAALAQLVRTPEQVRFGRDKRDLLPAQCRACDVLHLCNGECPKHRFLRTADGEPRLNYLCAGYRRFFRHVGPAMEAMAALLHQGRAPAEVMARQRDADRAALRTVGRNDPCPCGSGRKHKNCCLRSTP
jgi:uncharacterized protein